MYDDLNVSCIANCDSKKPLRRLQLLQLDTYSYACCDANSYAYYNTYGFSNCDTYGYFNCNNYGHANCNTYSDT